MPRRIIVRIDRLVLPHPLPEREVGRLRDELAAALAAPGAWETLRAGEGAVGARPGSSPAAPDRRTPPPSSGDGAALGAATARLILGGPR